MSFACPVCRGTKAYYARRCRQCYAVEPSEIRAWAERYRDLQAANRAVGLCEKVTAGGRGIVSELTVCAEKATRSGLCPSHRWQVMQW